MAEQLKADIVVVGSGAGGSAVAGELLRAGARVVVVEAGPVRFGAPGLHARNLDPSERGMPEFGRTILKEWVFPCQSPEPIRGLDGFWVSHGVGCVFHGMVGTDFR